MAMSAKQVFMSRDGMTAKEATAQVNEIREQVSEILDGGGSYNEVEELLYDYGLEMDYVFDFL